MTRFEKIQKMSIKELTEFIVEEVDCDICTNRDIAEAWLEMEVDDEE